MGPIEIVISNAGDVLRASERMLERSGDPRSRTIPRVVGALTNHVGRLRAAANDFMQAGNYNE